MMKLFQCKKSGEKRKRKKKKGRKFNVYSELKNRVGYHICLMIKVRPVVYENSMIQPAGLSIMPVRISFQLCHASSVSVRRKKEHMNL